MKNSIKIFVLALVVSSASSFAGPFRSGKQVIDPCGYYVQAVAGANYVHSGNITSSSTTLEGHGNYVINSNAIDFDEMFGTRETYGLRLGKHCGRNRVYVGAEFSQAQGRRVTYGNIIKGVEICNTTYDADDYSDWAILFGFERDFMPHSRLRPFVGAEAGLRFVQGISGTMIQHHGDGSISSVTPGIKTYGDSVTFMAGIKVGLVFNLTEGIILGMESGLRYEGGLNGTDEDLLPLGSFDWRQSNNGEGLFTTPLLGSVAVAF